MHISDCCELFHFPLSVNPFAIFLSFSLPTVYERERRWIRNFSSSLPVYHGNQVWAHGELRDDGGKRRGCFHKEGSVDGKQRLGQFPCHNLFAPVRILAQVGFDHITMRLLCSWIHAQRLQYLQESVFTLSSSFSSIFLLLSSYNVPWPYLDGFGKVI